MNKRKKRLIIAIATVTLGTLSLLTVFFLRIAPDDTLPQHEAPTESELSQGLADESQIDSQDTSIPADIEGEYRYDSGSSTITMSDTPPPSLLDLPGVYPASGEFSLGGVPEGKEINLSEHADRYIAVIASIKSIDPDFDTEGYRVEEHVTHHDENRVPDHGNVRMTLYIENIKTSSSCHVNIDGSTIQLASIKDLYHPTTTEIEQAKQQKADFEASSTGQKEIERVKASLWPSAEGTELYEYSEDYYFDFASNRLYLYINDIRWVGEYELRRREPRYGCIDVQQVLGR
ncbi:MAG: hypothetical protein LBU07_03935 [Coriobacteriales bacterium]|jgi:hypothetical protein|nr:hypothetical protein [Coriobacteriales bacterium]